MAQTYFFAIFPKYIKVQHGFAKTIKPNTKYRFVLYKGIQKCDQMKQAIKSKLVGGKIDMLSQQLSFNIPFYNPTKNIQFTLKLYQTKPNEEQIQLASYIIMSSDYIRTYKSQKQTFFSVDGQIQKDLAVGFDLFVQKSKEALNEAVKNILPTASKSSKQIIQQNKSQSSRSKQIVRQGDGFISPSRRLQRKRGHEGRLRSRNSSRQKSQYSGEGSVTSSRRKFRKSSPSEKGEHFLHSPKKASSPNVGGTGKSLPKSQASKSTGKKEPETKVQVNKQSYKYQPASSLKYKDTKQVFDIQIDRNSSTKSPTNNYVQTQKSPVARSNVVSPPTSQQSVPITRSGVVSPGSQKNVNSFENIPVSKNNVISPPSSQQNIAQKNSVARSNVTSPKNVQKTPVSKSGITSPPQSQTKVQSNLVSRSNVVSPPTSQQKITSPSSEVKRPAVTSPKDNKFNTKIQQLQIKHTPQIFDIVQRKNVSSPPPQQPKSPEKYNPKKSPKATQNPIVEQQKVSISEPILNKQLTQSKNQMKLSQSKSKITNNQAKLGDSKHGKTQKLQQSKVFITMQGSVHQPKAEIIQKVQKTESVKQKSVKDNDIATKTQPIKRQKDPIHQSATLRGSLRLDQALHETQKQGQVKEHVKALEEKKYQIYYIIFLVVSFFLIYWAMTPTRRV